MRRFILFLYIFALVILPIDATDALYWSPGPDDLLTTVVQRIAGARQRVSLAAYRLSAAPVVAALIAAQGRGVSVRVVLDKSSLSEPVYVATSKRLQRAGIAVHWGGGDGLLHHKYLIIDDGVVTGSANLTRAGLQRNHEVLAALHEARIVQAYVTHFEVLVRRCAGIAAVLPARADSVFFTPDESKRLRQTLAAQLRHAARDIVVSLYALTASWVWESLIQAARRGVSVSVLLEGQQIGDDAAATRLRRAGGKIYVHRAAQRIVHHKLVVIDDALWLGSLNLTGAAFTRNTEDFLYIKSPGWASQARQRLLQLMQSPAS